MTKFIQSSKDIGLNINNKDNNTDNQSIDVDFFNEESLEISLDDNYENINIEELFNEIETNNRFN